MIRQGDIYLADFADAGQHPANIRSSSFRANRLTAATIC
jgi:hypothetical protein